MPIPESGLTVQDLTSRKVRGAGGSLNWGSGTMADLTSQMLIWRAQSSMTECPPYWSVHRDNWLSEFPFRVGNDLLAGAMSTLVSRIASTSWYIEGPLVQSLLYRNILLERSDFGLGWDVMCPKWVQAYLCRDGGGIVENLRTGAVDLAGPCLGWAHVDESKCVPTGDPEYPLVYNNEARGWIKMHRSQVSWIVDMPNPKDTYKGVGFSSVARALTTAEILMDIVKYKRERLSDLPPAGILLINNMTSTQWEDIQAVYDARQQNEGNTVWRDIMTAFGLDPAYKLEASFLEFKQLFDNYDDEAQMRVAMYSFALAFRVDPREYWPVSSGPLGTATEAEIQQRKAKSKGEGIIFTAIERKMNSPYCIPEGMRFRFDYVDDEEDKRAAEIAALKIQNIRRLWESSPGKTSALMRAAGGGGAAAGAGGGAGSRGGAGRNKPGEGGAGAGRPQGEGDGEGRDADAEAETGANRAEAKPRGGTASRQPQQPPEPEPLDPEIVREATMGIITTEEARQLLIHERLIPPEILGVEIELSKLYDVRSWLDRLDRRAHEVWSGAGGVLGLGAVPASARGVWASGGPMARVYRDGRVRLFKRSIGSEDEDESIRSWVW